MSKTIQKTEKDREDSFYHETIHPNEKKSQRNTKFVHFEKGQQKICFPVYRDEDLGLGELAQKNLIELEVD